MTGWTADTSTPWRSVLVKFWISTSYNLDFHVATNDGNTRFGWSCIEKALYISPEIGTCPYRKEYEEKVCSGCCSHYGKCFLCQVILTGLLIEQKYLSRYMVDRHPAHEGYGSGPASTKLSRGKQIGKYV